MESMAKIEFKFTGNNLSYCTNETKEIIMTNEPTIPEECNVINPDIMSGADLKQSLCEIDNGRFLKVINTFSISDACSKCDYFNLTIQNKRQAYRCRCSPSCIAATLHPEIVSYLNWKLGWIKDTDR